MSRRVMINAFLLLITIVLCSYAVVEDYQVVNRGIPSSIAGNGTLGLSGTAKKKS